MPRPVNKTELLTVCQQRYEALMSYIDSLSSTDKNKEFPPGTLNRNIRDVLAHLYHWQLMMLEWYTTGMAGKKAAMPAPGYSWKDTPALNLHIYEIYKTTQLENIRARLLQTHQQLRAIIQQHSNEELFEKKRYTWTGSTSLGSMVVSATSSHYDWGLKLIKKCLRPH